ncbi:COG1576 Uncharacterized conserved protein [Rhabdaerophilaceae bacterium]
MKSGPERDLVSRYAERFRALGRGLGLDGPRIAEIAESTARRDEDRKVEEATAIESAIGSGFRRILFDERGVALDSVQFAGAVAKIRDAGAPGLALVIGGPDGLLSALGEKADQMLSFGRMTVPHQLVRILVLEQLYRASTILAGHPYHRA